MTTKIRPVCPHCGEEFTINLNMVDKLWSRVRELENKIKEMQELQNLKDIFGGLGR